MELSLEVKRIVRKLANARNNLPVEIIDGRQAPKEIGESGYYTTPSGKTRITYPSAYKWPKVYHCSTIRVTVGRKWLQSHGLISKPVPAVQTAMEFTEALELASVATNEASRGVDFAIPDAQGECTLVMTAKSAETGRKSTGKCRAAQGYAPKDDDGNVKPFGTITFDPRFILEYLANLPKSAEYVQLALTDSESAAILTATGIDGKYLLMCLSRDR